MTLQENSKTDKDHEVIVNFLCTTGIMKDNVLDIFYLVVEYDIFTKNALPKSIYKKIHYYFMIFICFAVKSQVTESFLPFNMILFYKMADMFQYDRKFLLVSFKVTISRKFSAS